jgi:type IV pilus assembly protein PilA
VPLVVGFAVGLLKVLVSEDNSFPSVLYVLYFVIPALFANGFLYRKTRTLAKEAVGQSSTVEEAIQKLSLRKPTSGVFIWIFLSIALIGIVASISIPQYQNYVSRAQFAAALDAAELIKRQIEDEWSRTKSIPDKVDYSAINRNQYLANADVDSANGRITLRFSDTGVASALAGKTVWLDPALDNRGGIVWRCSTDVRSGSFSPSSCQASE